MLKGIIARNMEISMFLRISLLKGIVARNMEISMFLATKLVKSEHVIQIRESTSRVRVCESRAHSVFNQSLGGSLPSYAISVVFARWNFLLPAAKRNNAVKFIVSLKQKNGSGSQ